MDNYFEGGGEEKSAFDTILEYDITGDFYAEIGTMTVPVDRRGHGISVVQCSDFSKWCN